MCSSTPDMTAQNVSAAAAAQNGADALNFYKSVYADQAPAREAAATRANAISDAELSAMNTATTQAQKDQQYREQVFQPLERSIVSNAQGYDTEAREDQAAGRAVGDVSLAAANARQEGSRALTRSGVNPSDGSYGAMQRSVDTNTTLAEASAANNARLQTQATGRAMMNDAANLGRNLPSQQATEQQLALSAGNGSTANAIAPVTIGQQAAGMVGQGYSAANQGYGTAGNIYGSANNIAAGVANSQNQSNEKTGEAIGSLALLAFSDKNAKKSIKKAAPDVSLAAIKRTPVSRWQYREGQGDGASHTGPMAQDVRKNFGEATAPGGKAIDLISLNGHSMNAVKALDKRVVALENAKKR